jgi:L-threonylcarbamoyladenylate synthase
VGLESTIVALEDPPRLLRPGGLPVREIEAALGAPLSSARTEDQRLAPGQLASHYAPRAALRLNATAPREGELFLGFGSGEATLNLSPAGDLREAAANLFGHLHRLDAMDAPIAVAPIPDTGLGRAINDRLARAAAPRGEGSGAPGV